MTSIEKARTFLGMTIVGDFDRGGRTRVPQRPASELGAFFTAVFAGGVINAVRWTQYTPYFNDGDPCVFSANEYSVMVRMADRQITEDEADEMERSADSGRADDFREGWIETESYGDDTPIATLIGRKIYATDSNGRRDYKTPPTYDGPHTDLAKAIDQLRGALAGGAFDDALLELFGDHATVTVPASGDIEISSYDHD